MFAHNNEDTEFKATSNQAEKVNMDILHFRQKAKSFPQNLGKRAGKFFYFKGVLAFFIWKNGQRKMMLTLLVKK